MIIGELKINRILDTMWSGGIFNPLSVIQKSAVERDEVCTCSGL